MTPTRRSFFGALFAPVLTRFWPKAKEPYDTYRRAGEALDRQSNPAESGIAIAHQEAQAQWEADYLAFYAGEQWDPAVRAERLAMGRPCLVFNKIPGLVHARICKEGAADSYFLRKRLIPEVVRDNRDHQVLYNFTRTAQAEILSCRAPLSEDTVKLCLELAEQCREIESRMA
jgi:hypothetical protein